MSHSANIFTPYKDKQFQSFIKGLGNPYIKNWMFFAQALGVDRRTILRWRRSPLAQRAIVEAVQENFEAMKVAGKNDWRMYREVLKMLEVKDHELDKDNKGSNVSAVLDGLATDYDELSHNAMIALKTLSEPSQEPVMHVQSLQGIEQ